MNEPIKLTRQDVLAWLRTLPPDRKFDYYDNAGCLFAAYTKEHLGYDEVDCDGPTVLSHHVTVVEVPKIVRGPIIDAAWPKDQPPRPFTVKEAIAQLKKSEGEQEDW